MSEEETNKEESVLATINNKLDQIIENQKKIIALLTEW
jgi:hypothetical protein